MSGHPKKSRGLFRQEPGVAFAWIDAEKAEFPITKLCQYSAGPPSGFYAARGRPESARTQTDLRLRVLVRASFDESHQRYGSPRIHEVSSEQGERADRKRVIRLMPRKTVSRQRVAFGSLASTRSEDDQSPRISWTVACPNPASGSADTTEFVIGSSGKLYLAVRSSRFSRFVVGWAVSADQ